MGLSCIIAPSYADIFFNNCFKNGILPIVLDEKIVEDLFIEVFSSPGFTLKIDLPQQIINLPNGDEIHFDVESFRKHCLVHGLDDIGLTLEKAELIKKYEHKRKTEVPWLFTGE